MDLDSWDLIHMRMLNGSVENWVKMYQTVFRLVIPKSRHLAFLIRPPRHLKPGYGWLEHVEMDIVPRCDDGTLPSDSRLVAWSQYLLAATQEFGRPLAYNTDTRGMLDRQGFVEVQEQIIKVPLNPWPADPHLKDIGRWYNLGLTQGLEALTLGPMTRIGGWSKETVDKLVMEAKREICAKRFHAYCNM